MRSYIRQGMVPNSVLNDFRLSPLVRVRLVHRHRYAVALVVAAVVEPLMMAVTQALVVLASCLLQMSHQLLVAAASEIWAQAVFVSSVAPGSFVAGLAVLAGGVLPPEARHVACLPD